MAALPADLFDPSTIALLEFAVVTVGSLAYGLYALITVRSAMTGSQGIRADDMEGRGYTH